MVGNAIGRFPLTLTLSLGEREQQGSTFENSDGLRFADRLLNVLPLPKGEGWGEGNPDLPTPTLSEKREMHRFTILFARHVTRAVE